MPYPATARKGSCPGAEPSIAAWRAGVFEMKNRNNLSMTAFALIVTVLMSGAAQAYEAGHQEVTL